MKNNLLRATILFAILGSSTLIANAESDPLCSYIFNQNLKMGSAGQDVLELQKFLNRDIDTAVAKVGTGSLGQETSSYGNLTKNAVIRFQEKYADDILSPAGLLKGTGSAFSLTRAKLNTLCASSLPLTAIAPTVSIPMSSLSVSTPAQPARTIAPAGAGGVPFTTITLTAGDTDVLVQSIVVERTGPGADGAFDSIYIADEKGNSIGDEKSFHSNHQAKMDEPFAVPAHSSKTLTLFGNMIEDIGAYAGQTPVLQVVAIHASVPVTGILPIRGTPQTINDTLSIGGATADLSPLDPGVSLNRYITDTGVRFSGIRITTNAQEDITLSSITWDQRGTVANVDLANVATVIQGVSYPTETDGRSFTSVFPSGIIIKKGETADIHIQGDLMTSGAGRTVKFDIAGSDDVALTGNTYGYGVGISAGGHSATSGYSVFITDTGDIDGEEGTPFFSGSTTTINGGTVTSIGKN